MLLAPFVLPTVLWEVTPEMEVVSVDFAKTVIRSQASLSYAEAQIKLDEANMDDVISASIVHLNKCAKILGARRFEAGALSVHLACLCVRLFVRG